MVVREGAALSEPRLCLAARACHHGSARRETAESPLPPCPLLASHSKTRLLFWRAAWLHANNHGSPPQQQADMPPLLPLLRWCCVC